MSTISRRVAETWPDARVRRVARRSASGVTTAFERDPTQLRLMLVGGFLLFLVPAAAARLTGWRWRPWPPGPEGYRSVVGEARAAAETYVPIAFTSW